ncbi:hydrolase [Paenibacillus sp. CAA11]|uniref:NUDIX hydrolase n=1 Tax=Paenibacillus sp. CAA11 TaxID=1532905 RepID=UPI000D369462|nr:NUDIX domain-containing protein [Paenibacillus sp. CAA11]AWB44110.1 hydrolase [Paenibacillus sp. CAA11]
MSQLELFDIFDNQMRRIGIASRQEVHRMGYWHETFHCWVVYESPAGEPSLLFQLRSRDKDTFAGKLDISCAGHLLTGEGAAGGLRELEEELGIRAVWSELHPCGIYPNEYVEPGVLIDREFSHVFLLRCNKPLADYNFQAEEIEGLFLLPISSVVQLVTGQVKEVIAEGVLLQEGKVSTHRQKVQLQDLVPHPRAYYDYIIEHVEALLHQF